MLSVTFRSTVTNKQWFYGIIESSFLSRCNYNYILHSIIIYLDQKVSRFRAFKSITELKSISVQQNLFLSSWVKRCWEFSRHGTYWSTSLTLPNTARIPTTIQIFLNVTWPYGAAFCSCLHGLGSLMLVPTSEIYFQHSSSNSLFVYLIPLHFRLVFSYST